MRTIKEQDVATGALSLGKGCDNEDYQMHGPLSVFDIKNVLPSPAPPECYLWQLSTTCTANQLQAVGNGSAVVKEFLVIEPKS
jgi:carboxypeptidase D